MLMLELIAQIEPMSLPLWAVLAFSVAMYPFGFLFGACSVCCQACTCGVSEATNDVELRKELRDWCCGGTPPSEITIRITTQDSQTADAITPHCDAVDGDYVLQLQQGEDGYCEYSYTPSCSFTCPEQEGDQKRPIFMPGIAVHARPVADNDGFAGASSVVGPGYNFAVWIKTNPLSELNDQILEHCGVYYGIPATLNENQDIILFMFDFDIQVQQEFDVAQCDMRGQVSGTMSTYNAPGNLVLSTYPGSPGESLTDCGGVPATIWDDLSLWVVDSCALFDSCEPVCVFDLEILP